jgi:hypothetical protein
MFPPGNTVHLFTYNIMNKCAHVKRRFENFEIFEEWWGGENE